MESAKEEADVFAEVIKGIDFELPVFYDYEYDSFEYAKKQGITVGKKLASDIVISFLERMKSKGYTVGNYVNPDLIQNAFDSRINKYDTWMAHYYDNPNSSKIYTYDGFKVIGWQYSSKGTVDGIEGNVDMNVFYIDAKVVEKEQATVQPAATTTTTTSATTLKAGQVVALSNTAIYNTASTASVASRRTGTYYLWSTQVIGGRIRITNKPDRVGVPGQVTGWMNVVDITTTTATPAKPAAIKKLKVGSKVKVKSGAKFYDGVQPAKFVYSTTYDVLSISGEKVVIGIGKAITGAMDKDDLIVQ